MAGGNVEGIIGIKAQVDEASIQQAAVRVSKIFGKNIKVNLGNIFTDKDLQKQTEQAVASINTILNKQKFKGVNFSSLTTQVEQFFKDPNQTEAQRLKSTSNLNYQMTMLDNYGNLSAIKRNANAGTLSEYIKDLTNIVEMFKNIKGLRPNELNRLIRGVSYSDEEADGIAKAFAFKDTAEKYGSDIKYKIKPDDLKPLIQNAYEQLDTTNQETIERFLGLFNRAKYLAQKDRSKSGVYGRNIYEQYANDKTVQSILKDNKRMALAQSMEQRVFEMSKMFDNRYERQYKGKQLSTSKLIEGLDIDKSASRIYEQQIEKAPTTDKEVVDQLVSINGETVKQINDAANRAEKAADKAEKVLEQTNSISQEINKENKLSQSSNPEVKNIGNDKNKNSTATVQQTEQLANKAEEIQQTVEEKIKQIQEERDLLKQELDVEKEEKEKLEKENEEINRLLQGKTYTTKNSKEAYSQLKTEYSNAEEKQKIYGELVKKGEDVREAQVESIKADLKWAKAYQEAESQNVRKDWRQKYAPKGFETDIEESALTFEEETSEEANKVIENNNKLIQIRMGRIKERQELLSQLDKQLDELQSKEDQIQQKQNIQQRKKLSARIKKDETSTSPVEAEVSKPSSETIPVSSSATDVIKNAAKVEDNLENQTKEANTELEKQKQIIEEIPKSIDNIMYHMGNLEASSKKGLSHGFGDEITAWFEGLQNGGRGWADGTGLYTTKDHSLYDKQPFSDKSYFQYYAIDTSGLKLYEAHAEETAKDFYDFIHHLEQYCIMMGSNFEGFDNNIEGIDEEALYNKAQSIFPNFNSVFKTFDDFYKWIDQMITYVSEAGIKADGTIDSKKMYVFKKEHGVDDIKTRFLKTLGYEGTDLSGTSYGGIKSGNVLFGKYDKSRTLAKGRQIDKVVEEAESKIESINRQNETQKEIKSQQELKKEVKETTEAVIKEKEVLEKKVDISKPDIQVKKQPNNQQIENVNLNIDEIKDEGLSQNGRNEENEVNVLSKVTESAKEAAKAKERFIDANINVPNSVYESVMELDQEAVAFEKIAKQAQTAAEAKDKFVESNKKLRQELKNEANAETDSKNSKANHKGGHQSGSVPKELTWDNVEAMYDRLSSKPSYIQHTEALFGKGHPELSDYQMFDVTTENLTSYKKVSEELEKVRDEIEHIFSMSEDELKLAGLTPDDVKDYIDRYKELVGVLNNLKLVITAPDSEENYLYNIKKQIEIAENELEKEQDANEKQAIERSQKEREAMLKRATSLASNKKFVQGTDTGNIDEFNQYGVVSDKIKNYNLNKKQADNLRQVIKNFLYNETTGAENDLSKLDDAQLKILNSHIERFQKVIDDLNRLKNEITAPDSLEQIDLGIKKIEEAEQKAKEKKEAKTNKGTQKDQKTVVSAINSDYSKLLKANEKLEDLTPLQKYVDIEGMEDTDNFKALAKAYFDLGKAKQEVDKYFKDGELINNNDLSKAQSAIDIYNELADSIKNITKAITAKGSPENTLLSEAIRQQKIQDNIISGKYQRTINTGQNTVNTYGIRTDGAIDESNVQNTYVLQLAHSIEELKLKKQQFDKEWEASGHTETEAIKKLREEIDATGQTIVELTAKVKEGIPQATDKQMSSLANNISKFFVDNPHITAESTNTLISYYKELTSGASISVDRLKQLGVAFDDLQSKERNLGNLGGNVFNTMLGKVREGLAFLSTKFSFYQLVNQFRQGIQIVHQFDDALTEMQKVSDETIYSLQRYQTTTFETARTIGASALQVQQSTADFMRLGESLEEAAKSAKAANVLMNVSEFSSIDEATKSLIAMSAAYNDLSKENIIDKLNEVGNNYAISTSEAATALQASASALRTANNDMDEALALVTAGNAVVQDATKVGTGIRTIALRLTGTKSAKEELEELGEDTDSMLTTQSKLRETIMEATAVEANNFKGFDILDDNGNYKSTYEIMLGIANIYNDILEADKKFGRNNANLLLETVAGKVRANIAASIFQNPDVLARAYQSSQGAEGSAMEENEKYMASISGHIAQIQTSWQELWANTANRDLINMFIDLGKAALDAANNIGLVPSALGLFTAYSSIMRTGAGKGLLSAFFKDLVAIGTSMEGLDDQGQQMVAFIRQDLPNAFTQSGQAAEKFKTRLGDLAKAGKGLISILANPAFLAPAAGFLILAGAAIIKKRQDDLRKENLENARSSATSMKEQNEQLNKQVDSYTELKNKLDSNILSEEEEVQVKQQILDIQNSITEKYGDHSAELDLINGKLYDQLEILKAIGAEEAKEDYFKNYEGYQAALEEYTNNQRVYTIDISGSEKVNKLLEQSGLQIREILNEQGFGIGTGIGAGGDVESLITTYENARKELQDYLTSLDTRTDAKEIQRVNEALNQTSKNLSELYQIRDDNKATALLGLREGLWSRQITSQDIISKETGQARTGYDILTDLEEASDKLTDAFMKGDYSKIDELREKFVELQAERNQFLEVDINSPFAILFDQINEELFETKFNIYDAEEVIDSFFGKKTISQQNRFSKNTDRINKQLDSLHKAGLNRVDIQNMFAVDGLQDYERELRYLMGLLGFSSGQQADFINLLVSTGIITGDLSDVTNEASQSYNEFSQAVAKGIENVSTLQSVMSESVSGKGISTQNIEAFRKMYSDYGIETEQALERTANGYHVNERSMYQLNEQYKSMLHMQYADALNDQYNALQKVNEEYQRAVANGADLSGYAAQKDAIYKQIQSLDDLMMQYQSANSAYQQWLTAQSGNGTRDMYDSIYSGYDTIKEEIEHGWAGSDKVRSWLDLIYNDEGDNAFNPWIASVDQINEKFKEVTKTIEGTGGKSIADFFTVDENGKSTSLGVLNFFDAVLEKQKEVGREFVRIGENGEYIFDFDKNGDYQIADLLGIDVEAVQAILRAAYDAGFTVNLDQPIYSIERLRDAAEEAKESLGFDVDINTDNIEQVDSDLERLQEYRDTLVKDQSIPLNVKTEKLEELDKLIQYTIAHKRELIEKSSINFSTNLEDVNDRIEKLQKNIQKRSKQTNWELPDEFTSDYLTKTNSVEGLNEMAKKIQGYLNLHPELDSSEVEYLNELFDLILEKKGLLESPTPVRVTVDTIQEAEKGIGEMNKELQLMKEYSAQGLDVEFSDDFKHYVDLIVAMPDEWKQKWNIDPNASAEDLLELYKEKGFDIQIGVDYSGDSKQKLQEEYGSTPTKINPLNTIIENREFNYTTHKSTTTDNTTNEYHKIEESTTLKADDQSTEVVKDAQEVVDEFGDTEAEAELAVKGSDNAERETAQVQKDLITLGNIKAKPMISLLENGASGVARNVASSILSIPTYRESKLKLTVEGQALVDEATRKVNNLLGKLGGIMTGGGGVNGTAHFQGTAFARGSLSPVGNAFKSGDWGVPKDQTALVNEVGEEIIVRDGKWFVANGGNAGFVGLKKGDVVFNSEQTKELLENGYVTGRKRASIVGFANGTAYSSGSGLPLRPTVTSYSMGGKKTSGSGSGSGSSGSGNSGNSSANDNANDFLETLDEIEIKIDRLERKISNLDTIAGNTYYQYGVRNEALIADLSKVGEEIDLQRKAYQRYIRQANSVGLSADWAQKVREGAINIEDVKDQALWDKIQKFKEWHDKALDARDAIQGLMQTEADLWQQRFDLDQNWYENEMTWYQHESDIMETMISTMESKGRILTDRYYKVQLQDQENILALLKEEKEYLETDMEQALKSGDIDVYSEGWYGMKTAIDDVCASIEETEGTIADLQKSIRELRWENFDYILETVDALNEEIEFLYSLLNEDKMFDDKGHITNQGLAGLGLYTSSYNVYLQEAQKYADEIKEVNKELANDPYNKDIIDRQKELYKAHQDAIKGANDQKQAIADLIEEGIKKQIDSLKDLIDKYQDLMDEEKDQIDYAKKIADAQKEVNTIQKQLNAYERDDSEEGATRRQQLRNQLKQAQENLADTEEERRISETKKMLGELQEQYEDILNTRLDNIDKLIADVITEVNNNSSIVSSTITEEADKVGYTISQPLVSGFDNLSSNLVTLNSIGSNIASGVQSIVSYLSTGAEKTEEEATTEINAHDTMHEEFKQNQSSADSSTTNKNSLTSNEGYDYGLYQQGWNMDEKGWFYINSNGEMPKNTMQNIGGTNYHFDSAGYMEKSKWVAQGSDRYHLDDYGRAQTGWQKINYNGKDEWFLFDNQGKMLTGLQSVDSKNYYLDTNTGAMAKNKWVSDGKYWRYFDGWGVAQTGWFYDSSAQKWAYLDPATNGGKLVNQWHYDKGLNAWYWLDNKGWMVLNGEFQTKDGKKWFDSHGRLLTGKGGAIAKNITGYKSGTDFVPKDDIYKLFEEGNEAIVTKTGTYRKLNMGDMVLNKQATDNLYAIANDPASFIRAWSKADIAKPVSTIGVNSNNNITMQFNLPNVQNATQFISEMKNNNQFIKWLQEVTLGQAAGHNILRKNAIKI